MARRKIRSNGAEPSRPPPSESQRDEFYHAYEDYSRSLRTWFVAYGIGFPVLAVSNDSVSKALIGTGSAKWIVGLFICGVALQVIEAGVNKWCMWLCYEGEESVEAQNTKRASYAYEVSKWWLLDVACDLGSVISFVIATWMLFGVFFK